MGCQRRNTLDGEMPIGTSAAEVALIPDTAVEGQMTFKNVGTTTIFLRVGLKANSTEVTAQRYSLKLGADQAFSEEGIVPGQVSAIGDGAGGFLSYYISFSEGANCG